MSKLEIHRGKRFYKEYVLPDADVIVIGRTYSSDVVLPDESRRVSPMHAALVRVSAGNSQYFIRDLGSAHGTYVNGSGSHQQMLNDGDAIGIGNYRLIFWRHTQQAQRRSHLKVGRSGGGGSGSEASTSILKLASQDDFQFTAEQSELLEQMNHSFQRGTTLPACAADLVAALLRTIHADRGLIGILPQSDEEIIDELGVTNLREQDVIEISGADFAQHLRQRETFEDAGTVLVPFGPRANVLGFLCINRRDQRRTWTSKDIQFLQSVARLMPASIKPVVHVSNSDVSADEPMGWPIEMVGRTAEWLDAMEQIRLAASSQMNMLVLGETGSGKELVAKALHQHSSTRGGPFLARNCSQTTETLAESEIFGYAPKSGIAGADPTGAPGWFELANGGTLFLDEVHRLTPAMQDKFLRVLQDKQVSRIGAKNPVQVDVNVIAATDEEITRSGVEGDRFRQPFLFRFGKTIQVPPLRHRREDIPLLAFFFLDKYSRTLNSRARTISRRGVHFLWNYDWPGNVRQLENVIRGAMSRDHEVIFSWDLEDQLPGEAKGPAEEPAVTISTRPRSGASERAVYFKKPKSMDEVEKDHIIEALEVTHGNVTHAAEILGYKSRQTMLNKMDRYGIPRQYAVPQLPE